MPGQGRQPDSRVVPGRSLPGFSKPLDQPKDEHGQTDCYSGTKAANSSIFEYLLELAAVELSHPPLITKRWRGPFSPFASGTSSPLPEVPRSRVDQGAVLYHEEETNMMNNLERKPVAGGLSYKARST